MVNENGRIPANVLEFWVFPKLDNEGDIKKWFLEERLFSQNELNRLEKAKLTKEHLSLLIDNEEDPVAISLIYSMSGEQLDRFKRYIPSDAGQLHMGLLNSRWIADNALIEGFDIKKCNEIERRRDYLFTKRARAYWAISNRYNQEIFVREDKPSIEGVEEREEEKVLVLSG